MLVKIFINFVMYFFVEFILYLLKLDKEVVFEIFLCLRWVISGVYVDKIIYRIKELYLCLAVKNFGMEVFVFLYVVMDLN